MKGVVRPSRCLGGSGAAPCIDPGQQDGSKVAFVVVTAFGLEDVVLQQGEAQELWRTPTLTSLRGE